MTTEDQVNRWAGFAMRAWDLAMIDQDPTQPLKDLAAESVPGNVWRSIALAWADVAAEVLHARAIIDGMSVTGFVMPETAPPGTPELAAQRTILALLHRDPDDAAVHFTVAWNASDMDAGQLVVTVLAMASDIVRGGGSYVNLCIEEPEAVTIPDDASSLAGD